VRFEESQHPRDRRRGVRTGGQFVTAARPEGDVALTAQVDDRLIEALARYGLTVHEVPADHEGASLEQRWAQMLELAQSPDIDSLQTVLDRMLGNPEYGRHRGGPQLVWAKDGRVVMDPALDATDTAYDADDPRWDDPAWSVLAEVSTRNGGGNRECWCEERIDDRHELGCLVPVITALQAHPAYLEDRDEEEGYASFYFRVPDRDAARAALAQRRQQVDQTAARSLLASMQPQDSDGYRKPRQAAPWEVMPANPATVQAARSARARLEELREGVLDVEVAQALGVAVEHRRTYGGERTSRVVVNAEAAHFRDVHTVLEWAADPSRPAPELSAAWRHTSGAAMAKAGLTMRRVEQTRAPARRATAARAALESGDLHADVAQVLRDALGSAMMLKGAEAQHAAALASLDAVVGELRALLPSVQEGQRLLAEREELTALAHPKPEVLRWPGDWRQVPQPLR